MPRSPALPGSGGVRIYEDPNIRTGISPSGKGSGFIQK